MARTKQFNPKRVSTQQVPSSRKGLPLVPIRVKIVLSSVNKPQRVPRAQKHKIQDTAVKNSIPKRTFQKLVKKIAFNDYSNFRFTPEALSALQTAAEDFMVGFFEDAVMCMQHAKRKTLMKKDMEMVERLQIDINY